MLWNSPGIRWGDCMRRAVLGLLASGILLLALSPVLFVTLAQGLLICPNPGVCREELDWTTLIPGIVALSLGICAVFAAWILSWSRPLRGPPA